MQEPKYISTQERDVGLGTKGLDKTANKSYVQGIEFHRSDMGTTTGEKFECDAARPGKKIQSMRDIPFEVNV